MDKLLLNLRMQIYKFYRYRQNNKNPFLLGDEKLDVNQNYEPVGKLLICIVNMCRVMKIYRQ